MLDSRRRQRLCHVLGLDLLSAIFLGLKLNVARRYLHAVLGTNRLLPSSAGLLWGDGNMRLAECLLSLLSEQLVNLYFGVVHGHFWLVAIEQEVCDVELFELWLAVGDPGHAVVVVHLRSVYQLLVVWDVQEEVGAFVLRWHDLMSLGLHQTWKLVLLNNDLRLRCILRFLPIPLR